MHWTLSVTGLPSLPVACKRLGEHHNVALWSKVMGQIKRNSSWLSWCPVPCSQGSSLSIPCICTGVSGISWTAPHFKYLLLSVSWGLLSCLRGCRTISQSNAEGWRSESCPGDKPQQRPNGSPGIISQAPCPAVAQFWGVVYMVFQKVPSQMQPSVICIDNLFIIAPCVGFSPLQGCQMKYR